MRAGNAQADVGGGNLLAGLLIMQEAPGEPLKAPGFRQASYPGPEHRIAGEVFQ